MSLEILTTIFEEIFHENEIQNLAFYASSTDCNLISLLIKSISILDIISCNQYYKTVTLIVLALVLGCQNPDYSIFETLENAFIMTTANNSNFNVGCLLIDCWLMFLSKLPDNAVYYYFIFWCNFYKQSFTPTTLNPSIVFVGNLLQRIYDILTPNLKIQFNFDFSVENNKSLWILLRNNNDKKSCIQSIEQSIGNDIEYCISGKSNMEEYYNLVS